MSLSFRNICSGVKLSLDRMIADERGARIDEEARRERLLAEIAAWAGEQQAREARKLDIDGVEAARRAARDAQEEQERLDFIAASIARRQAKHS